jgi:hypothetical protein
VSVSSYLTVATVAPHAFFTVMEAPMPLVTSFPSNTVEKQAEPFFFTVSVVTFVVSRTALSVTPFG